MIVTKSQKQERERFCYVSTSVYGSQCYRV